MQWLTGKNRPSSHLKGYSYKTALAWTLLLPVWKASDTSRNLLQSCLVFHSILDLLLKTSFWANFYLSYYIILSYLVKNSIQRNMNRRGEKCVSAGREKLHSFTKITREMNKKRWANNHICFEYRWEKGYMYLENQAFSTLNLRQWYRLL